MIKLDVISKAEAARYMGVKGEPDDAVRGILERIEPLVRACVRPAYVYRETTVEAAEGGIRLGCVGALLTGESIAAHLKGCSRAVIFAATLSPSADAFIRRCAVSDMADALAADSLCSAAIEQVCDKAEEEIFSQIDAPFRTWRFSPGYGDLPISLQEELLHALNAQRRIGLTVTDSCLLVPSKSVTAVIGISDSKVSGEKRGCSGCSMYGRCAFSQSGIVCGNCGNNL